MERAGPPGQPSASLTGSGPERERRPGLHPAGTAAARLAGAIVARRGGGILARAKAQWTAIVGAELAALTWPEALGPTGVLKLRVVPGRGLELQHRAPLVIERINAYFGRQVAVRLALVQGNLPLAPPPEARQRPVSAEDAAAVDRQLVRIADSDLRGALTRLGQAVLASQASEG
jgi:hypothetical protein